MDANSGYFFYPVNVTRSSPVLYREYRTQDGELFPRLSPLSIQIKGSISLFAFFFDFRADCAIILEIKSRINARQSTIQISRALRRILMLLIFPEESWVLEWIRTLDGYVWRGNFDLNTVTCGRGNFLIRWEKVADCWRGLSREPFIRAVRVLYTPYLYKWSISSLM